MKKTAGLVAAIGLLLSACGSSNSVGESSAGAVRDSVEITGNWTIEVLNPDGSLDQRVEFQNAITGPEWLAFVLSMEEQLRGWQIWTNGTPNICDTVPCTLDAVTSFDVATEEVVLSASMTALNTGIIDIVRGALLHCVVALDGTCDSFLQQRVFSFHNLAPVDVAAGQSVQIEVRYLFS